MHGFDFALYAEGEPGRELCVLCWKTWYGFPVKMGITPCETKKISLDHLPEEDSKVKSRRNDRVRCKNEISESYLTMFRDAQSHITILCSYFLPGIAIRKVLSKAARRGVK